MIGSKDDLIANGILVPSAQDWRVTFSFVDGTERVVRVSPSSIPEEQAIARASAHAKILDASVLDRVTAERVSKSTKVAAFGIVQK